MKKATYMAEMDPYELACRIAEGVIGAKRPEGKTAKEALAQLPAEDEEGFLRAAKKVFEYMQERLHDMQRQQ